MDEVMGVQRARSMAGCWVESSVAKKEISSVAMKAALLAVCWVEWMVVTKGYLQVASRAGTKVGN